MKDVLICCTNAEGSQLEWLAKALFDTGWSVNFMHKGSSGVTSAHCVIAVWSPKSVGDAWLMARAKTASKRRKLVSIRLGGARPPRGLRSEQVIDLSEWPAKGADRAMNTLLGSVDAVASGTALRGDDGDGSRLWLALAACALLIGGGYALFRLAHVPSQIGGGGPRSESYVESARAADTAAAAEHAMRSVGKSADRADAAADGERVIQGGEVPAKPDSVTSDAARVGAQSLSQLAAAIDGGRVRLDDIRRSAEEALALDPQQPHARATLAVLRGLVDLQWTDARDYVKNLDARSSDAQLASVVGSLRALLDEELDEELDAPSMPNGERDERGQSTERGSESLPNPDMTLTLFPHSDPLDPLCGIVDDAAFAQAIVDLDGVQRLTLLKRGCVVERIRRSPKVRQRLGIAGG